MLLYLYQRAEESTNYDNLLKEVNSELVEADVNDVNKEIE